MARIGGFQPSEPPVCSLKSLPIGASCTTLASMIWLRGRLGGRRTLRALLGVGSLVGLGTVNCGGNGGTSDTGGGGSASDGVGGDGSAGDGSQAGGNGGSNPDIELTSRVVDCEDGLQLQTSSGDEWTDEGDCQAAFITTWDTTQPGASEENQVQLPLVETGSYEFWVSWGDGSYDYVTEWDDPDATHTYDEPGDYEVRIVGEIVGIQFQDNEMVHSTETNIRDAFKLATIDQWGPLVLGDYPGIFAGAVNMTSGATDAPDLSQTTILDGTFSNCQKFNGQVGNWDTSTVARFVNTFNGAETFNQDLSGWDTSNATGLIRVFQRALAFDQPLNSWDVSQVTTMEGLFFWATSFDQPLDTWDVSNVKDLGLTFRNAESFNQDISGWDVSNVANFAETFAGDLENGSAFNQDISEWSTSSATNMTGMFRDATSFNANISTWETPSVTDMSEMFMGATSFDRDISGWNISSVTDMSDMLTGSGLSSPNYSLALIAWSAQDVQSDVPLGAGTITYSASAEDERQSLIEDNGWIIADGGQN